MSFVPALHSHPSSRSSTSAFLANKPPHPELRDVITKQPQNSPSHSRKRSQNSHLVLHNIYFSERNSSKECSTLLDEALIKSLPSKFKPLPALQEKPYTLSPSGKDKGLGMFANRDMRMGALVLVERPIVVSSMSEGISKETYRVLFERLDEEAKAAASILSNATEDAEGIVSTNAFRIELGEEQHQAVFLDASRFNHSCSPNAAWKWDSDRFCLCIIAVRSLRAGEEITIPYIDTSVPRAQRQERLRNAYHFNCHCFCCDLPSPDSQKSDRIRQELGSFWQDTLSFDDWCADSRIGKTSLIDAHKRALEMREIEGLQLLEYRKHVDIIAMCYGALKDVDMFREWIKLASDCRGEADLDHSIVLDVWYEDPETFTIWGWKQ